jgi:uncharacterized repeat protein (TIGR04138 family)
MQAHRIESAIDNILERDQRFEPGAYLLLQDALTFTLKRTVEEGGEKRHVSGQELLFGFRDFALQEFGPMAATLLHEWGVQTCGDVGDMVFLLIEEGMFGKQDSDAKEDFLGHFEFDDAFRDPFLPKSAPSPKASDAEESPVRPAPQDAS